MTEHAFDRVRQTARHNWNKGRLLARWLSLPPHEGLRPTPRRVANFYASRYEQLRGHIRLQARPLVLHFEANNTCNLRCPGCFTGLGVPGRQREHASLELYRRLLDELGDHLLYVEPFKWGEPLLHNNIYEMVRLTSERGIATSLSTNFSVKFDGADARQMVRSGLAVLGVAIDGATQDTYEVYRRGGDITRALENVRRLNAVKRDLASATPRVVWEYHVFPHNRHEIDRARGLAAELGVEIAFSRGWVVGEDRTETGRIWPGRCHYLWQRGTVNADSGVAACCGSYYGADDFGRLSAAPRPRGDTIEARELRTARFMDVWNNERFRAARALFSEKPPTGPKAESLICYQCPIQLTYADFRAAGSPSDAYESPYRDADGYAHMMSRGSTLGLHDVVPVWGPGTAEIHTLERHTNA